VIADFIVLEGRKVCHRVVDGDAGGKRETFFPREDQLDPERDAKQKWRTLVHFDAFNRFVVYRGGALLDEFIACDA